MSWTISVSRRQQLLSQGKSLVRQAALPVMQRVWNHLPEWTHHPHLTQLGIALTRICNADCTFCAYQFMEKDDRRNMPEALFQKVVEQVAELRVPHIHLSPNMGDPLVAPRVLDKIQALRGAGVQLIYLTTNGILLDKVGIADFLEHGPDIIGISTSGFDEEMYKRVYRSKQYKRVRHNVLELLRQNHARPKDKRRYISIRIRADVPKEEFLNYPDMPEVLRLADDVKYNELYGDWGGAIKASMLTGNMKFRPVVPHANRPCAQLYNLAIHPDGEILACACQNIWHDKTMSLGYLSEPGQRGITGSAQRGGAQSIGSAQRGGAQSIGSAQRDTSPSIDLRTAWQRLEQLTDRWKQGDMPTTCQKCTMYNDPAAAWPGLAKQALVNLRIQSHRQVAGASYTANAENL